MAKAFDSVNHEALFDCAQSVGVPPPPVLEYFERCYGASYVKIKGEDEPIQQKARERQGNPAPSRSKFNTVIDKA